MSSTLDSTTARRRGQHDSQVQGAESNGEVKSNSTISLPSSQPASTTTSKALSTLQIWAPTLLLIFGGCCSNVYTLESLISASPTSGTLLTFLQFLLVSLFTLPRHLDLRAGARNLFLKERNIPLRKWIIYTAYFLAINILNNRAFRYKIGVPLHIILRSAGPVTTMLAGRVVKGRRYPMQKVVAVVLLFSGVVLAAISDAAAKQGGIRTSVQGDEVTADGTSGGGGGAWSQAPGFALLASALILAACMGLYTDDMYATHGRSGDVTAETLFYSHAMSLPYFLGQVKPLFFEFTTLMAVPSHKIGKASTSPMSPLHPASLLDTLSTILPVSVWLLAANAATQLVCIIGVNRLSSQSSSLTVSIVLNIRKLVSLLLSIVLFGNQLPLGVMVGAAVVFAGGGLYALPTKNNVNKEADGKKVK